MPPVPPLVAPPLLVPAVVAPPTLEPPAWLSPLPADEDVPARGAEPPVPPPPEFEPATMGGKPAVALAPAIVAAEPPAPAWEPSPSAEVDEQAAPKISAPSERKNRHDPFIEFN